MCLTIAELSDLVIFVMPTGWREAVVLGGSMPHVMGKHIQADLMREKKPSVFQAANKKSVKFRLGVKKGEADYVLCSWQELCIDIF